MKKYTSIKIIAIIGIMAVISFMGFATYAYYTVNITGEGKKIDLDTTLANFKLEFKNTSTASMTGAYTGDSIVKEFTVKNLYSATSYYDIIFDELANSFVNKDDLVFDIVSIDGGANRVETIAPSANSDNSSVVVAANIPIESGKTHTYKITITFKKTKEDQSANMDKTFSAKIYIRGSLGIFKGNNLYKDGTIAKKILADNTITSAKDINYNASAVNGLYSTNSSIDGKTVYFFRGSNTLNNNIIINNMCFKIVRFTENKGIRLIYNGISSNGTCSNTSTNPYTIAFNTNAIYNAYVGLMWGSANSSTYASEHMNTNNSNVLTNALYLWMQHNMTTNSNYLVDSVYCNNRKTKDFTYNNASYGNKGNANLNTGYETFYRLNTLTSSKPNYDCINTNDRFTVDASNGNGKLTSSVGLLSADEAVFAGLIPGVASANNYLNNGTSYWTLTPAYFYSYKAYNYNVNAGTLGTSAVNTKLGIRPVITIDGNLKYVSGTGSLTSPYQITK